MSRVDSQQGLMPSILDRLIDPDSGGTSWRFGYGVEQMVDAVRRDLEDLLNTRVSVTDVSEAYSEVRHSVLLYGLPDLNTISGSSLAEREFIGGLVEQIIARFEPRLKEIRAISLSGNDQKDRTLRYHIQGKMSVEPAPEVEFETVLNLTTGQTKVQMSSGN